MGLISLFVCSAALFPQVNSPTSLTAPLLVSPVNGAIVNNYTPTLLWRAVSGVTCYQLQLAPINTFSRLLVNATVYRLSYTLSGALPSAGVYYWRVRACKIVNGMWTYSPWSAVAYFRTLSIISGRVVAAPTGTALAWLRVAISGTSLFTTTDASGRYILQGIPVGQKHLAVWNGLYSGAAWITVTPARNISQNFRLASSQPVLLPPAGKVYHGIFPGGHIGAEDDLTLADLQSYESAAGEKAAWVYFSNNWYVSRLFPLQTAFWIRGAGSIPYIRLMLRSYPDQNKGADPLFNLPNIIKGNFDTNIRAWGRAAVEFGTPLIVEYGTEVNGEWFSWNGKWAGGGTLNGYGSPQKPDGPERFVDAYRRIIRLISEEGAGNITWVFHVNNGSVPAEDWNRIPNYYPGDTYVDWIAVSAYGAQTPMEDYCDTFRESIDNVYPTLAALSPTKPIIIAEFGVTKGNAFCTQESWADAALADITTLRWPRVIAFSWWNEAWQNDDNPAHDTTMRLQDNLNLATVFQNRVGSNSNILDRLNFTP